MINLEEMFRIMREIAGEFSKATTTTKYCKLFTIF